LPQANIEIHRNLVPTAGDPAGGIVPTGGVPAGSDPTSSVPTGEVLTGSSIPASSIPAGGVLAVKGGTVTFGGGDGKITGKDTIRTSKLNFENVYYVEEL
nr:hypothetical protein [Tanacetum cinerariifolium]